MTSSNPITTPSEFISELEKFQQVFDHNLELLNETDVIDKGIAESIGIQAKALHQAAVKVLPRGKNKDQILRHLTWCHKDTVSWIRLFSK